jgi:phage-related protein
MLDAVINLIFGAIECLVDFVIEVIDGVISFIDDVVGYFKKLSLVQGRDIPFALDGKKFREILANAPVKNIGIFEGVYNEQTNKITDGRYISGEDVDAKTKEALGKEGIAVFS